MTLRGCGARLDLLAWSPVKMEGGSLYTAVGVTGLPMLMTVTFEMSTLHKYWSIRIKPTGTHTLHFVHVAKL